jgi:hypothetical protein
VKPVFTLRKEHILRLFNKRVLRKILGSKGDKTIRDWRRLHSDELHDLYRSPGVARLIKSRSVRWVRHVAHMGKRKLQDFGGKT